MLRKILINLEATSHCPAACSMCPRSVIKKHGFITPETMQRTISQIDASYVWELSLAGRGEPTIHPQFPELLQIMARAPVKTDITTTGVTFTEKNIEACINNIDIIRLSVSSIRKEVFDRVHIGLNHQKIWKNISALAEANTQKVIIHLTGGPAIYESLPETVAHLRRLGFENMYVFPLWNRGGDISNIESDNRRAHLVKTLGLNCSESEYKSGIGKYKFALNAALGKLVNRDFCAVGDGSISISYSGEILGCFQDFGHTSNIGNIYTHDLKALVDKRVRQLGKMPICKNCNINQTALKLPMFWGKS
nr:radical SAM protein [uncultured Pseudomonas sp.]